ncbi:MAG: transglycosylase SLT domain-containing protein [Pseudomonadota bacterium]
MKNTVFAMHRIAFILRVLCLVTMSYGVLAFPSLFCPPASAEYPLLKEAIIARNLKDLEKSLGDGTYRGEEGILRIRPEVAKRLGLKVFLDQDYLDSKDLFERAEKSLEKAYAAMVSDASEAFAGQHAANVVEHFLLYKNSLALAKQNLMVYRARVNPANDERLNETAADAVTDRLLTLSLKKTEHKLRDALGLFHNTSQGINHNEASLTPENIAFVNEVFHVFTGQSSKETLDAFNLDRDDDYNGRQDDPDWKRAVGRDESRYADIMEAVLEKHGSKGYRIDPLLFFALMRRESNFDHLAVSSVGAAGLTQIMPRTAIDMGMKNIFEPKYLSEAAAFLDRERKTKAKAKAALNQIEETNGLHHAKRARELMQQSLAHGEKRERLYAQYRRELLRNNRTDERLNPSLAVEYGYRYFAALMKEQKGDISLALASYNAGPYRVRQYKGIPPFEETVRFRNRVLEFYRDYLKRASATRKK